MLPPDLPSVSVTPSDFLSHSPDTVFDSFLFPHSYIQSVSCLPPQSSKHILNPTTSASPWDISSPSDCHFSKSLQLDPLLLLLSPLLPLRAAWGITFKLKSDCFTPQSKCHWDCFYFTESKRQNPYKDWVPHGLSLPHTLCLCGGPPCPQYCYWNFPAHSCLKAFVFVLLSAWDEPPGWSPGLVPSFP